jgi:hypothetical protein
MKVGIVSDTHGNLRALEAALKVLSSKGAEAVVHCGDVGNSACIRLMGACGLPVYVVAGNMDRHVEELAEAAGACGVNFLGKVIQFPVSPGVSIAVTHGDDPGVLGGLIECGQFRYVCRGHTHRPDQRRVGGVRVINPGALERTRRRTVALLDTEQDTLEHLAVNV